MIDIAKPKILMVDNTPANIDVLRHILGHEGFEISVSMRGEAALALIKKTGRT